MSSSKRFDKFGSEIVCRFCKNKGRSYNHHPNTCSYCYTCGKTQHHYYVCPENTNPKKRNPRRTKEIILDKSARRKTIVNNRHLLTHDEPVAIDVEKVQGHDAILPGWVSVVRYPKSGRARNSEKVVFSAKIRQLRHNVKSYASKWSGIYRIDVSEEAVPYEEVKPILADILKDRLIVGLGLQDDLKRLQLDELVELENRFEFGEVFTDGQDRPIGLKKLAYAFLGKKIQEYDPNYDPLKGHNPVIDARITMEIYNAKDKPYNQPIYNPKKGRYTYQWCRNLVDEAIVSGKIQVSWK